MPDQISLFEGDGTAPKRQRRAAAWPAPGSALEQRYERYRVLAASLPPGFRMGTSSWSFPGWLGIVYARKRATSMLAKEGLHEYAQHPLLQDRRDRPQLLRADPGRRPASLRGPAGRPVPVLREGAGGRHLGEHPRPQPAPPESRLSVGADGSSPR